MTLEGLEKYREKNGRINIDKFLEENKLEKVPEIRGASNKEKDWVELEDSKILLRTENLDAEGVEYTTYAELIFEELAKQVGIQSAHYDLITYKGKRGVLSQSVVEKDETLVHIKDLLDCYKRDHDDKDDLNIHVEDAIKTFHTFYETENGFSKEDFKKISNDFLNMAIFDIYAMSTDRHGENMGIIYSVKDGKETSRLAPMFDNECSLMLDSPKEKIQRLLKNRISLMSYVEMESQRIYYAEPDYDFEENDKSEVKEINEFNELLSTLIKQSGGKEKEEADWQTTIYNISELGEEQMEFIKKCDKNLNIEKALESVEERIGAKLPNELCEFVSAAFNTRKMLVNEELGLYDLEESKDEEIENNKTSEENKKGGKKNEDDYILG